MYRENKLDTVYVNVQGCNTKLYHKAIFEILYKKCFMGNI